MGIPAKLLGKKKAKRTARPMTAEQSRAVLVWQRSTAMMLPINAVLLLYRLDAGENLREHWAVKRKRIERHRMWGSIAVLSMRLPPSRLPCTITFTRYSPRLLDEGDNLPNCFKHVRDQIAEDLGTHDGPSAPIKWEYKQERAPKNCFGFTVQWSPLTGESNAN